MSWGRCLPTDAVVRLLFGQASFNKLTLKISKLGLEQTPVAGDIIAMSSQASQFFVHHRRHPLTVVTAFPLARGAVPRRKKLGAGGNLSRGLEAQPRETLIS